MKDYEVQPDLDEPTSTRLGELARHLRFPMNYKRIAAMLTEKQQTEASCLIAETGDIIQVWASIQTVSHLRAVVDMSYQLAWIGPYEHEQLLVRIGEKNNVAPQPAAPLTPEYRDGVLSYNGGVARRVKQFRNKSGVEVLLEEFQAQRWPRTVRNPWYGEVDQEKIYQVLHTLKSGLNGITFEVLAGGE